MATNKVLLFIVAFFLGWLGVHRWGMLGYKTSGIVMAILSLFGIGFLWWLIDIIFIIIGKKLIWPE